MKKLLFTALLPVILFFCKGKQEPQTVIASGLTIENDSNSVTRIIGLYIANGFKSNLKWFGSIDVANHAKADSIFEVVIEGGAARDTSGNWNVQDAPKALEALYQVYLEQIKDKIKITK